MELSLKNIADRINATVIGDGSIIVCGVSGISDPKPGTVLFVEKVSMLDSVADLNGFVIIVPEKPGKAGNFLVHEKPRKAFAEISALFNPPYWMDHVGISKNSNIEDGAVIHETASIGSGSFVGTGASIGKDTRILPNAYIGRGVKIGDNCAILPGASILEGTTIGDRVIVNSNAVIGSEGFGFTEDGDSLVKIPQAGGVEIGDDVEIGACTCIDRGTIGNTVIGNGTKLDNLVQIAHNVKLGKNVRIASQAGLPGRVTVGDEAIIAGQAGIQNGIEIGRKARIAGQAGVFKSVKENETVSGYPAMEHEKALEIIALTKRLPELFKRVKDIEEDRNK